MLRIINPATEELLVEMNEDDASSIERKAAGARAAQPDWASTPLAERLVAVKRFGELLASRREPLAATLTAEMGKPIRQARSELGAMQERIHFFLGHTESAIEDEVVLRSPGPPPLEERIRYEPLGVVANISAWNYPYFVGSNVFLPALLTGNAVLYKPSEHATLTGLAIAGLLHEAGVPQDVFVPVVGAGGTGAALLAQDIDAVCFTGSYATGRKIAEAAAPRLMHVQLELGGKDPAYVCEDVHVEDAAAALAEGAFYNAGQSCCAVERIYVHRRIAGEFTEAFTAATAQLAVGDPIDESTDIGPLARRDQLDVLEDQVGDAVALGARLALGGRRREGRGYYFEPTVLTRASHEMKLMREESFGPIIGIQEVADDAEAVAMMNDTEYGLTAAVYTPDRARAERILARVNAGSAYWNCCDRVSPRLPWSGRRHSGLGTTLSVAGIRAFVQPKAWHLLPPQAGHGA
ncbi:MAG TPA: aldehyde dehydrogenase family protein [Gemmatimonadaceae bacterium]|nr:aldehyde dehydrogenase family protein [Gemmatimonadaceae bacterium]